jgi:putative transposase
MDDAERTTDARESVHTKAYEKSKLRKARMASAVVVKAAARRAEKEPQRLQKEREQLEKKQLRQQAQAQRALERQAKQLARDEKKGAKRRRTDSPVVVTAAAAAAAAASAAAAVASMHVDNDGVNTFDAPIAEHVHVEKPPPARMKRYKLRPNKEQMVQLRKAFGVATWTYNQCLDGRLHHGLAPTIGAFRKHAVNSDAIAVNDATINEDGTVVCTPKSWVVEVPYSIRDEAAKDLMQALKSMRTNVKNGDARAASSVFRFQSKHRKSKKIVINSQHYKRAGVFHPTFFGTQPFRCFESALPDKLMYGSNLTMNWLNEVYLCVPLPLDKFDTVGALPYAPNPIAAIDPGVRTFGTVYDPMNDRYVEWGANDTNRIQRLHEHMDNLESRMASKRNHARWRMKRAWRRMSYRIENRTKDLHFKYAKWLCMNYRVILLPHFNVAQMVRKNNKNGKHRNIGRKTARTMLSQSHCMFRDRLIGMSRRYPGCHVIQLSEAYTSKTCRCCGAIHTKLGASKVFTCPSCAASYPRDDGGASNIFLRYATFLDTDRKSSASHANDDGAYAADDPMDVCAE